MTQLTRLRTECGTGYNCPALDRREDGGIEVTGHHVHRDNLPDGEAVVLVPDALLPELAGLDVPDLAAWIEARHTRDLFRLETLDHYDVASDDDDFHRYVAGADAPTAEMKAGWVQKVRDDVAAGKGWRRVHVVRTPLTPYLCYEMEWGYTSNAQAGEDIRVLDVTTTPAAEPLLKVGDFFVVNGIDVVRSRYDEANRFLGATAAGADHASSYAALADLAWNMATPFAVWWAAHPQYHRGHAA